MSKPAGREKLTVSPRVLASLEKLDWDELNDISTALGILETVDLAITLELCRMVGAARAFMDHCFDRKKEPMGSRPRADVIASAVRESYDRWLGHSEDIPTQDVPPGK